MHNCCNNYTRSQLLRSAAAEAGKGLPAIEPGMPEPGRDRALAARASSPAAPAWRSPSTAPRRSRSRPSKRGSRRRRRATRSSSRSSSTAASTRSACSPRSATRATRSCGRTSRSRPKRGTDIHRGHRACAGTPRPPSAGDPARRGQGQRLPGDRLRPSRPVALHLAPLLRDRRARGRLPDRLARPLPRPGRRRRQPAAGALDGRLALADDRHRRQAGGGDRQRRRLRPLVRGRRPGLRRDVQQLRQLRLAARPTRPAWPRCGGRPTQTDKLRKDLGGVGDFTSPVDLPRQRVLPQARRPRRLHRRRPADATW